MEFAARPASPGVAPPKGHSQIVEIGMKCRIVWQRNRAQETKQRPRFAQRRCRFALAVPLSDETGVSNTRTNARPRLDL